MRRRANRHRRRCSSGFGGVLWPLFWTGESQIYLAVVCSVFGLMLIPFAYLTFAALINSRSLLGDEMPSGVRRLVANRLPPGGETVVAHLVSLEGFGDQLPIDDPWLVPMDAGSDEGKLSLSED